MPEVISGATAPCDVRRSRTVQIKDLRAVLYQDHDGTPWVDVEVGGETVCLRAEEFWRWDAAVQDELERV